MPAEGFYIYSAADFGLSGVFDFFFAPAIGTVGGTPDLLTMTDNDTAFDDEGSTGSSQLLDATLTVDGATVGAAGDVVQNIGQSVVTNFTTGQTGLLVIVQVNGVAVGVASNITLNTGDELDLGAWLGSPTSIPYADLTTGPVCFTRGTLIATALGPLPVEALSPGDLVLTRDHGPQPLRWVGNRSFPGVGRLAPVCFSAGALGNRRALTVSPLHRMLVGGWRAELLFGESEVLVPARDLVNGDTIYRCPQREVGYYHLMFDRHEIIFAEGVPSESFAPESAAIGRFGAAAQAEIMALFPELASTVWPDARPALSHAEATLLGRMG